MGNLRSVEKALERVGSEALISSDPAEAMDVDGLILPGVGAFPRAMERIRELELDELIAGRVAAGTPVLGICLGMQLIFERSEELGGAEGLGLIPGKVRVLDAPGLKIPHIGWSATSWRKGSRLTTGMAEGEPFYFVHSFTPAPADPDDVLGAATYGGEFVAAVERGLVFGAQFHPEKSSSAGLRMLQNFVGICTTSTAPA